MGGRFDGIFFVIVSLLKLTVLNSLSSGDVLHYEKKSNFLKTENLKCSVIQI